MTTKEEHQSHLVYLLIALFGVSILAAIITGDGPTEEDLRMAEYCRMVALYRDDPSTGWPDYEGTFAQQCTPDGKLKE